jgi:hypothetical protein
MNWTVDTNWTPNQVPVAGDSTYITMPSNPGPVADYFCNTGAASTVGNLYFTMDLLATDTTTAKNASLSMFSQQAGGGVFTFDTGTAGATESLVTIKKLNYHSTYQQGLQLNTASGSNITFDLKNDLRFANVAGYHGSVALEHAGITGTNRNITIEAVDPAMTMGMRLRYNDSTEAAKVTFTGNWVIKGSGFSSSGGPGNWVWGTTFNTSTASTNSRIYLRGNNSFVDFADPFGPSTNGIILKGGTLDWYGGSQSSVPNTFDHPLSGTGVVELRDFASTGLTAGPLAFTKSINIGVSSVIAGAPDEINFFRGGLGVDVSAATLNVDSAVGALSAGTYTILQMLNNFAFTGNTFAAVNLPPNVTLATTLNTLGNIASYQLVVAPPSAPGWISTTDGNWNTSGNWIGGVPNAIGAAANFNPTNSSPFFVFTDTPVIVGSLKFDSPNQFSIGGAGSLTLQVASGAGTINVLQGSHKINLPSIIASDASITVASGATLTVGNPMTIKTGKTVTKTGAFVMQSPLTIEASGVLNLGSGTSVLFGAPTLGSGAKVNVQNGSMLISYQGQGSPAATVKSQLTSGYASGAWSGAGINTSSGSATTGLGWKDVSASEAITVKYTYYGDADLSGTVDSNDFNALVAGYGTTAGANWVQGDFNYDGKVNTGDFNYLAGNFGLTIPAPAPTLGAAVPEPGSLLLVQVFLAGLALRNRRS